MSRHDRRRMGNQIETDENTEGEDRKGRDTEDEEEEKEIYSTIEEKEMNEIRGRIFQVIGNSSNPRKRLQELCETTLTMWTTLKAISEEGYAEQNDDEEEEMRQAIEDEEDIPVSENKHFLGCHQASQGRGAIEEDVIYEGTFTPEPQYPPDDQERAN